MNSNPVQLTTFSSILQKNIRVTSEIIIYFLVILSGFILRVWQLDSNALHHDESLHAVYSWYLYSGQGYIHDPMMHGPFQYHMNTLIFFFGGDSDFTSRLGYALLGTIMIGMPLTLKKWIGKEGALIASILIAFSPSLIYFSRFARNDILIAVWTLGLFLSIMQYIHDPNKKYLYASAIFLSLSFTTKETAYLSTFALCALLFFLCSKEIKNLLMRKLSLRDASPACSILILISTLFLPLCSASIALIFKSTDMTLANSDPLQGPIGLPLGNGILFAWIFSFLLILISTIIGIKWNPKIWITCALLFLIIFILMYSSFLTNPTGIVTGSWQSLGYWIAQQGVQRGNQPFYYYFILLLTYEYTIVIIGILASIYFIKKGDIFDKAILIWAATTTLLFLIASEKMPWLIVHMILPWILIVSKFLGIYFKDIPLKAYVQKNNMIIIISCLIIIILFYKIATYNPNTPTILSFIKLWVLIIFFTFLLFYFHRIFKSNKLFPVHLAVILAIFSFSLILQIRTGYFVSFIHGDVPKEMLIYTQTSQDVRKISLEIERLNTQNESNKDLFVIVDTTDGFAWPWVWYLRNFPNKIFYSYDEIKTSPLNKNSVLLINTINNPMINENIANNFVLKEQYQHRAWFPENYKELSMIDIVTTITDVNKRKSLLDYWLFRKFQTPIGHVDGYLLYSNELER